MNLRTLLLLVILVPGCHYNKLDTKYLTTVNVKRNIPVSVKDSIPEPVTQLTVTQPSLPPSPQDEETVISPSPLQNYHIIAASHPTASMAEESVARFRAKGLSQAQIIRKDNRYRVSIVHSPDRQQALRQRDSLAVFLGQNDLWLMRY